MKKVLNVLFTSAGRRVELLRLFRAAYEDLGLKGSIVAVDIDPLASALQVADRAYIVPRVSDPKYVPTLVRICEKEKINLVFPLIDPDIPVLAAHKDEIERTGARVVVVSHEAATVTQDKWLTYKFLLELGIPTPKSWIPSDVNVEALPYPVFLKPRVGSAGKQTFKVDSPEELRFFLKRVHDPLIQEFLPGPEITNDVICDFEGEVLGVVSRKRIEVRSGEVSKGKTVYHPEIIEYCVKIAKGLKAIGPITIQCMLREGKPYFTEINARFGGGVPLGIRAGVKSPHWLLAIASRQSVDIPPLGTYQTELYLTRCDESFFLTEDDYAKIASSRL